MHINLQPITPKLQLAIVINQLLTNKRIQLKQAIEIEAYETIERHIIVEVIKSPLVTQQITYHRELTVNL